MKIAYFDCSAGISGDMILGALTDLGMDLKKCESELKKLNLPQVELKSNPVLKNSISALKVDVSPQNEHAHRTYKDIVAVLKNSSLGKDIIDRSIKIFHKLALAEAKIHSKNVEEIHFHEIGAVDSIADIVGAVIGLNELKIEKIFCSKIHVGSGFVKCQHGEIPLPAPATLEILKDIPLYSKGINSELTTPTGAAIIATVAESFGNMPEMTLQKIGYGAGSRDLEIPNILRVWLGETEEVSSNFKTEEITLLETNIDNISAEQISFAAERIWGGEILDLYLTPIQMKKNRPATMLSVMVKNENVEKTLERIYSEIPTLGIRVRRINRSILSRETTTVETKHGKIRIKIGKKASKIYSAEPEYEDCKKIARDKNLSINSVYEEAKEVAQAKLIH